MISLYRYDRFYRHRQSCTQCGLKMTSHSETRNAHDVIWKQISWQRQRRTCYRVQYHNVTFMSAFLNYRAQQTSYIVILCTTKILLPPRFLKCTFPLPALSETCFEVNTLGEFAPDRSVCCVGEGTEGGGWTWCPCNVILASPHWVHDCRCLLYMIILREKFVS